VRASVNPPAAALSDRPQLIVVGPMRAVYSATWNDNRQPRTQTHSDSHNRRARLRYTFAIRHPNRLRFLEWNGIITGIGREGTGGQWAEERYSGQQRVGA